MRCSLAGWDGIADTTRDRACAAHTSGTKRSSVAITPVTRWIRLSRIRPLGATIPYLYETDAHGTSSTVMSAAPKALEQVLATSRFRRFTGSAQSALAALDPLAVARWIFLAAVPLALSMEKGPLGCISNLEK